MNARFRWRSGRVSGAAAWTRRTVLVALLAAGTLAPAAMAQPDAGGSASVALGLGGNLVAGAWNPLQVTLRDAAPGTLSMRIDQGDLVTGPRIVRYQAAVPGGSGVTVFDDDVYVPPFQSLTWRLVSHGRVLASGSLGARDADRRPLQVVVSANPGAWRAAFGRDARFVDVAASQLPARAAAYDGVATLLLDGTAAAPRSASVAAAAAGGVDVLLVGTLPASQAGLARLAAGGGRIGAGRVRRVPAREESVVAALTSWRGQDRQALVSGLAAAPLVHAPRSAAQPLILSLAAAYALLTLLAVRFGGMPGTVAAAALALLVSLAGWRLLRPPEAVLSAHRSLMLGGGELALALGVDERLTLPAGVVSVATAARPLGLQLYSTDATGTHVQLARWHGVTLALRPTLADAALRLQGGRLYNAGRAVLRHVYVVGAGAQGTLDAGESRPVTPGEEGASAPELARLSALLPDGSALAEGADTVWVALPAVADAGGRP